MKSSLYRCPLCQFSNVVVYPEGSHRLIILGYAREDHASNSPDCGVDPQEIAVEGE